MFIYFLAEKTVIGNLLIDLHLALAEACKRRQITGDIKEIPITVMVKRTTHITIPNCYNI